MSKFSPGMMVCMGGTVVMVASDGQSNDPGVFSGVVIKSATDPNSVGVFRDDWMDDRWTLTRDSQLIAPPPPLSRGMLVKRPSGLVVTILEIGPDMFRGMVVASGTTGYDVGETSQFNFNEFQHHEVQ